MSIPMDDLVARLHAAADAVPPSTLDLPVVLRSSRRKATVRRLATGTAASPPSPFSASAWRAVSRSSSHGS
ncbi:hypothetical protein NKG05_14055 [Oerskovia sp. M15]